MKLLANASGISGDVGRDLELNAIWSLLQNRRAPLRVDLGVVEDRRRG
jgi:hypothetical protein